MPESWRLTQEHYRIIETQQFNDPESEEYNEAVEYAARRVLLQWILQRAAVERDEYPNVIVVLDLQQWDAVMHAHGLDEGWSEQP